MRLKCENIHFTLVESVVDVCGFCGDEIKKKHNNTTNMVASVLKTPNRFSMDACAKSTRYLNIDKYIHRK